jgi:hypothetical protein
MASCKVEDPKGLESCRVYLWEEAILDAGAVVSFIVELPWARWEAATARHLTQLLHGTCAVKHRSQKGDVVTRGLGAPNRFGCLGMVYARTASQIVTMDSDDRGKSCLTEQIKKRLRARIVNVPPRTYGMDQTGMQLQRKKVTGRDISVGSRTSDLDVGSGCDSQSGIRSWRMETNSSSRLRKALCDLLATP